MKSRIFAEQAQKEERGKCMGALIISSILCVELGKFSIADFIISKAVDIGTGKLWSQISRRFNSKEASIEAKLYYVIEKSVVECIQDKYNTKDIIAPICEKIYATWIIKGRLSEDQLEQIFHNLPWNIYVSGSSWCNAFYKKVAEDAELYNWFSVRILQESNNKLGENQKTLEQINKLLDKHASNLENIHALLEEISGDEGNIRKKRMEYEEQLIKRIQCPIWEETFSLQDIYISLMGKNKKRNIWYSKDSLIVDTTSYIWKWLQEDYMKMLFLHGEPGSGKSSLVKMIAATTVCSDEIKAMVVFIDLYTLTFSDKISAFKVVESYIMEHTPWFLDENDKEARILILDGLDEIKYRVYENAIELVRELENCNWDFHFKILVSGRTQIVLKAIEDIRCEELEILPLYLRENEKLNFKTEDWDLSSQSSVLERVEEPKFEMSEQTSVKIFDQDLRWEYWFTLGEYFEIHQGMPLSNDRFQELSRSPLLLFLIVWTIKNGKIQLSELKNSAELYERIFYYVYTRKHNRTQLDIYYKTKEFEEYQHMLKDLGVCAFRNNSRNISIREIYKYSKIMNNEGMCQRWIQSQKEDNPSKLVLFFFFHEIQNGMDWENSEIVFIHKTFYEYLAACAIIEFICGHIMKGEDSDFLSLLFFLFSKNKITNEITGFISEIVESEALEVNGEKITAEIFGKCISQMMRLRLEVDYPVFIENQMNCGNNVVYKQSITRIKQAIKTFETNINSFLNISCNISKNVLLYKITSEDVELKKCVFDDCTIKDLLLERANFAEASFKNCVIDNTYFIESVANRTYFQSACFYNCKFKATFFAAAEFESVRFIGNRIRGLTDEDLFEPYQGERDESELFLTEFQGANLCNAYFEKTSLFNANFTGANLKNVDFIDSVLNGVDFTRADLTNVKFNNVKLSSCKMKNTILYGVSMAQFDLKDMRVIFMLAEANLTGVDWTGVDETTKHKISKHVRSKIGV